MIGCMVDLTYRPTNEFNSYIIHHSSNMCMKILFTGDVMLGRLVSNLLKRENYTCVLGDTLDNW